MRFAGSETGGEEDGTHTGKALLQVHEPDLRHVPVGSAGDQAADHEDGGSGRGSNEEEVREDAARGDSTEAGGEGGRDADQGRMFCRGRQQDVSRCTRDGAEDDEPSRSEASRDNANHLRRTQNAAGVPPESTDVDDHGERVQQVMADPALHAQTVQQALELKKNMEDMMKSPSACAYQRQSRAGAEEGTMCGGCQVFV